MPRNVNTVASSGLSDDPRDRIANSPPNFPNLEPQNAEEQELTQAERVASRQAEEEDFRDPQVLGGVAGKASHELPPQLRPQREQVFTMDRLLQAGLSDNEIMKIMRETQGNDGLVEFDQDTEAERIAKLRTQSQRIAVLDGGDKVRTQLSVMERYFAGAAPRGDGEYCKRYPYVSPVNRVVGINGYIFHIPRHKRVMLPAEALDLLEQSALAQEQYDVLSAVYASRQYRPIESFREGEAGDFKAQMVGRHSVRPDLIPNAY